MLRPSWCQTPIWGPNPDSYYCQTVAGLLMWGVLSKKRRVSHLQLLLVLASLVILGSESCGTHDHILQSQIRASPTWRARSPYLYPPETGWPSYTPWHWITFSSSPTTRRATVEIFESASAWGWTTNPRYKASARIAQERFVPLLHILSFPEKQRVHRAVTKQRLLYCRLFSQLLLGNGCACHNINRSVRLLHWTLHFRSWLTIIKCVHRKNYPSNRPWKPIRLRDVEAPTFSR
jgi:hypothetical protein